MQNQNCAGMSYFKFLEKTFAQNYRKYHNGVEGIRKGEFRCPYPIDRIPPPVPDYSNKKSDGSWHYHTTDTLPKKYKEVEARPVDELCPSEQLSRLMEEASKPDIVEEEKNGWEVSVRGSIETWKIIQERLDEFVDKYTGQDLSNVVHCMAKGQFGKNLRKSANKIQKPTLTK